jgi:hypothetical protein
MSHFCFSIHTIPAEGGVDQQAVVAVEAVGNVGRRALRLPTLPTAQGAKIRSLNTKLSYNT